MPVSCLRNGHGNKDTCGIYSLPYVEKVHSAGHLLNQDCRETLRSQALVHAQEVNLGHGNFLATDNIMDRDTWNETKKLILLAASDTKQPLFVVAWGSQSPFKELDGVVEAEHVVVILNIVLSQQVIDFLRLCGIVDVNIRPIVARWEGVGVRFNISDCFNNINGLIKHWLVNFIVGLGDWLRVPEIMHVIEGLQVIDMLQ